MTGLFIRPTRRPQRGNRWRRVLLILAGLALLAAAPLLAHAQAGPDSVRLAWTAPGDDGSIGTATSYEMRMDIAPIDVSTWASATVVADGPAPAVAGTRQTWMVRGLDRAIIYYFAIRAVDDVGNWAALSNVLRWDWVTDTAPPSAPGGITAQRQGASVHVHWTANGEPDLLGYTVFRATSASGPFSALNGTLLGTNDYVDSNLPADNGTLWYQVSATDETGNQSARSATATAAAPAGSTPSDWSSEPGYPNPSGGTSPVTIAVIVPASGGGGGVIDITDSAQHRIRRIDLSGLSPGRQLVVWDGKNDAGRLVAPGTFTAWVIAGSVRSSVRLVRVP